ncbi:hypothetical protein BH10PSE7_BH10PSE7_21780 [soil metagenome]
MRILRKLVGTIVVLSAIAAVPAVYLAAVCTGRDGGSTAISSLVPPELRQQLDALPGYREEEARSYLSYPDWYAIFVARDYARFIDNRYPSGFGFLTAALEYWRGYCAVNRYASVHYPFDWRANLGLYAYGIGHSVKYTLNGLYENTIGRLSEAFAPVTASAEDLFARSFADDYSEWLLSAPWYDYPFFSRLQNFWESVPFLGPGQIRKLERRFALSAELAINGGHAALVKDRPQAAGEPQEEIHAVMKGLPGDTGAIDGRIRVLQTFDGGLQLVQFPRGEVFSEIAPKFVGRGAQFLEIAGNDTILITATGRNGWSPPDDVGERLFETPILSGDGGTRFGISVPVPMLITAIEMIATSGGRFERVYDY